MKLDSSTARILAFSDGVTTLGALGTPSDGDVLTVQADGTAAWEAAGGGGIPEPGGPAESDLLQYTGGAWDAVAAATVVAANPPATHASSHAPGAADAIGLLPLLLVLVFGSGRDGALVFDGVSSVTIAGVSHSPSGGVYTLTRSIEASSITMSGCTIAAAGYPIRCSGTWTCTGTNVIKDDGNAASGSTAGTFLSNATNPLSRTATAGGNGAVGLNNGSSGSNSSNSGAGGTGGAGGNSPSRSGGSGGTSTTAQYWQSWFGPFCIVMANAYRANGGTNELRGIECGSGGGGGAAETGGVGGGGGGGGGLVAVWCYNLVISSGTTTFRAAGGAGAAGVSGNAGGGGGGGGGLVQVITYTYSGSPTLSAAGGALGALIGTGSNGNTGSVGRTRLVGNSTVVET